MIKLEKLGVIVAVVTSIIGAVISCYALYQAKEANNIARTHIESNLTVEIVDGKLPTAKFTDHIQSEVEFLSSENSIYGAYFFKEYNVLISNQGMKPVLLEDEQVMEYLPNGFLRPDGSFYPDTKNYWGTVTYEFTRPNSNNKLIYPIKLDTNSYEVFLLKVEYSIPRFVWDMTNLVHNKKYSYSEAEEIFNNIDYPFWGQFSPDIPVKLNERTHSPNKYFQEFCLIIRDNEGHNLKIPVTHHIHTKLSVHDVFDKSSPCKR